MGKQFPWYLLTHPYIKAPEISGALSFKNFKSSFVNTYSIQKNNFLISTDKEKLQPDVIHTYLSEESYWAKNISKQLVLKTIEGSYCFGMYDITDNTIAGGKQIGYARVVTDYATFGYLADVFILTSFRGMGLSKWLMQEIMNCPALQGFRRWMLATRDAHGLYEQFGFTPLPDPGRIMQYNPFTEYPHAL